METGSSTFWGVRYIVSEDCILLQLQRVRKQAFPLFPHPHAGMKYLIRDLFWFSHLDQRVSGAKNPKLPLPHLSLICNHDSYTILPCIGHPPACSSNVIVICIQSSPAQSSPAQSSPAQSSYDFRMNNPMMPFTCLELSCRRRTRRKSSVVARPSM